MRIGELAERTGVSVRSLRYYETQGLLASTRTPGGQRDYPETAVDRVIRIQEMFAAGLHSRTMAELLPCIHDADGTPNATATPFLAETLVAERERIDACIRDLHRTREVLDEVIQAAQGNR
ncbi:MerR family transcriptional regulator [Nocardia cyriacigeorgica]|jgi:DNA-binding transcriptional MerR regulator|uniref:MerR family transcriptional regulator n=1 Tax=Nocardia cyriacigeorgica TaxID=135487 RepID=UPI000CE9E485|nr:MerR family transcriptional regulator [Nocardia cyriacigeorgica]AVH21592.1 MerR family transcriptional regulator [Nocardia cyriacigeorgica]MBF6085941.1 MerR family transcriptional regulator [Nocardia cyriacigeorgica]MBF6092031.1 MerR family transcriptional regulator [Nocardia cyriacigeorgica]MBF6099976.1 MerR family transcriptional regulator [Nocardia cyriacigeorgica]MBF6321053.1 MerR family transcriptional regulator [Nocardia cyriacigeorgica]